MIFLFTRRFSFNETNFKIRSYFVFFDNLRLKKKLFISTVYGDLVQCKAENFLLYYNSIGNDIISNIGYSR